MNMQGLKRSDWELEHCGCQRVARDGATFSWLNSLMNNNRSCSSNRTNLSVCMWLATCGKQVDQQETGEHETPLAPAPTESIAARTPCPSAVTTAWNLWLGHWNKSPWLMIGISLPSEFVPESELRFTPLPIRCQSVRLSVPLPVRPSVCQSPKSQPQLNEKQRLQRALNCADCFGVALLLLLLLLGNLSCVLLYCCNTWISTRGQIGGEPLTALVNADDRRQTRASREVAALVAIKPAVNRINIASWQRTQLIKPAQPIFIVMAD